MLNKPIQDAVEASKNYLKQPRFNGIKRLYSARQVAEQQGTIHNDYTIAKEASIAFYNRLKELFKKKKQITTFGPYTPSQAVMMKRAGIEGIYLGGWATSAKGSMDEDPGADLAGYPLSQVPNEAASIVRALLTADKNQCFQRFRMKKQDRQATREYDFRPFIIADADTGHGGEAHVRNLIRRFVEAGITGYHIEDQKPGTKKCGHQGGKVLVSCDEQIKRLNAARLQLDIMRVPGIIVARTDAEAASLIEHIGDERDHPFILGATNKDIPSYKHVFLALQHVMHQRGATEIKGHELYHISDEDMNEAIKWLESAGITKSIEEKIPLLKEDLAEDFEKVYDEILNTLVEEWRKQAAVCTYSKVVTDMMTLHQQEGHQFSMSKEEWIKFAHEASLEDMSKKAIEMGLNVVWNCEKVRTPEGYYQVEGGIPFSIFRSLAVASYADMLWMETKTADLKDAKQFAEAIHAKYPEKMLAYNLSPSFNWDSTGMTEEEMMTFPDELGKMGFVFNFITYGGHQIDGLVTDEFANALQTEGMLALARIQRKFRLLDSPYKTPQTHVGGPRLDSILAAASGRTSTTKAMGKGSTQFQHLIQTELPLKVLNEWLQIWANHNQIHDKITVKLRPHTSGSTIMELSILSGDNKLANIIFASLLDRNQKQILSIKDQNTFEKNMRRKRLMTLLHIFLVNRFKIDIVHYLTPTPDNEYQCKAMARLDIYGHVHNEVGHIIVAEVNRTHIKTFLEQENTIHQIINKDA